MFGCTRSEPEPAQAAPNINIIDNARQMINGGNSQPPINVNLDSGAPPPLPPRPQQPMIVPNVKMAPMPVPYPMPITPMPMKGFPSTPMGLMG